MIIEQIRQQLINEGLNPDDYAILPNADGQGYQAWKKEVAPSFARFAIQEDKTQKEDIDIVADTAVIAMMNIETLADTVVYLLGKVEELEGMLNG